MGYAGGYGTGYGYNIGYAANPRYNYHSSGNGNGYVDYGTANAGYATRTYPSAAPKTPATTHHYPPEQVTNPFVDPTTELYVQGPSTPIAPDPQSVLDSNDVTPGSKIPATVGELVPGTVLPDGSTVISIGN